MILDGQQTIIINRDFVPKFTHGVSYVAMANGALSLVDLGSHTDRWECVVSVVGAKTTLQAQYDWLLDKTVSLANDGTDQNVFPIQFSVNEKIFGAEISLLNPILCRVTELSELQNRTISTLGYMFKVSIASEVAPIDPQNFINFPSITMVNASYKNSAYMGQVSHIDMVSRSASSVVTQSDSPVVAVEIYATLTDSQVLNIQKIRTTDRTKQWDFSVSPISNIITSGASYLTKFECVKRLGLRYWMYKMEFLTNV